jgi:hypothetical protein
MKTLAVATLITALPAAMLASLGLLIALSLDPGLPQYPGALPDSEARHNLRHIEDGHLAADSSYRTDHDSFQVWNWYRREAGLQPSLSNAAQPGCWLLEQYRSALLVRRATAVTICPVPSGTLMYVHQEFGLLP